MRMGIHRVAILFFVILFFMGVFWGLSLRVFALHTNFFSCMENLVDCLSAGYKTAVCIYPFFLLSYFSLGWVTVFCTVSYPSWEKVAGPSFFFVICLLYRSCLYVRERHERQAAIAPTRFFFYLVGVGCFFFQSSINSCVRAFGTNIIVKTWSTICAFPAPNTSKSGIFFPTLISPPVLVSM